MIELNESEMELINKYSIRELKESEVFAFEVTLCDNEVDRDGECFSAGSLDKLSKLFVGRTGIFDHDPRGANQTARIYQTEVLTDNGRVTRTGEAYKYLSAKAYLMRTEKNADLIKEIEGGIKKEVSVSCAIKRERCSICNTDRKTKGCSHIKGSFYDGRLCCGILEEPTDAYEWSFVAVPAQPGAGVRKSFTDDTESERLNALKKALDKRDADISKARRELTAQIIRLGQFCVPAYDTQTIKNVCAQMDIDSLIAFKEKTQSLARPGTLKSVLSCGGDEEEQPKGKKSPFIMPRR